MIRTRKLADIRGELAERGLLEAVEAILAERHATFAETFGPGRRAHQVAARRAVAGHLRGLGWSLSQVAATMGFRDHTSAWYLLKE